MWVYSDYLMGSSPVYRLKLKSPETLEKCLKTEGFGIFLFLKILGKIIKISHFYKNFTPNLPQRR